MGDDEFFDDLPDDLLLNALENVQQPPPAAVVEQKQLKKPTLPLKKPMKHRQLTLFDQRLTVKPTLAIRAVQASGSTAAQVEDAKVIVDDEHGTFQRQVAPAPANLSCRYQYDASTVGCWIYPTNYPVRPYQFRIVKKALFSNTLVCLPTGLGKTFIAAVVMYNYWRWFPDGKIVFMAPTKPLVAQQIEACFKITGLPQDQTAELTGQQSPTTREEMWRRKRMFFLTPQVLQNDLQRGTCDANSIVCIVVDEAHRSTGNYAYCEVIKMVYDQNPDFRILALSATPGSDIKAVQQVVTNLKIARIEIRTEESIDVQEFTHNRQKEVIAVQMTPEINAIKSEYSKVLQYYIDRLMRRNAFYQRDVSLVSKYQLLNSRDQWRKRRPPNMDKKEMAMTEGDFALLISLYHAYELLLRHGMVPFHRYLAEFVDPNSGQKTSMAKKYLISNQHFQTVMSRIESAQLSPTFSGHPKLEHLESIVLEHFTNHPTMEQNGIAQTRVMIFSEFRDSVDEIVQRLNRHDPLLRVISFVGQASKNGKGLAQKEQLEVIRKFQSGNYNVLVATSIGEEGLDIGEVDLIICFDSQSSPVRMLQRMGRTGRKRDGRIVVLVSEGKEEQQYRKTHDQYKNIQNAIQKQNQMFRLWEPNPRVIPMGMGEPVCIQTKLSVPEYQKPTLTTKSRSARVSEPRRPPSIGGNPYPGLFTTEEWFDYQRTVQIHASLDVRDLMLTAHSGRQTKLQATHLVSHSTASKTFVHLMSSISTLKHLDNSKEKFQRWQASLLRKAGRDMLDESCLGLVEPTDAAADQSVIHVGDRTLVVDLADESVGVTPMHSSPVLPALNDLITRSRLASPVPQQPVIEELSHIYDEPSSDTSTVGSDEIGLELATPPVKNRLATLFTRLKLAHELVKHLPDRPLRDLDTQRLQQVSPTNDVTIPTIEPPVTPYVENFDDFDFGFQEDSILLEVDVDKIARESATATRDNSPVAPGTSARPIFIDLVSPEESMTSKIVPVRHQPNMAPNRPTVIDLTQEDPEEQIPVVKRPLKRDINAPLIRERKHVIVSSSPKTSSPAIALPQKRTLPKHPMPAVVVQPRRGAVAKKRRPTKSASALFDTEAAFSDASTTDEENKPGRKKRRPSCANSEDEDEDSLDALYAKDPDLVGFVVSTSQATPASDGSSVYHRVRNSSPVHAGGAYKMKFAGHRRLSERFVDADQHLHHDDEEYENDSFVVGDSDPIEEDEDSQLSLLNGSSVITVPESDLEPHRSEFKTPLPRTKSNTNRPRRMVIETPTSSVASTSNANTGAIYVGTDFKRPLAQSSVDNTPAKSAVAPTKPADLDIQALVDGVDFGMDDFDDVDLIDSTANLKPVPPIAAINLMKPAVTRPVPISTSPATPVLPRETNFTVPTETVIQPHISSQQSLGDRQLTVLVDNRELKTTICGLLRTRFKLKTMIRQLVVGDYIVSSRMGIERKSRQDLLNSVFNKRLSEQLHALIAMYDEPVLIVEEDSSAMPEYDPKLAQYEGIKASITRNYASLRVFFTRSKDESARLIHDLCRQEARTDSSRLPVQVPTDVAEKKHHFIQTLVSIPSVSYITASNVVCFGGFRDIRSMLTASVDELMERIPYMSRRRAQTIVDHLQHKFTSLPTN